jgi:hypothetical protein
MAKKHSSESVKKTAGGQGFEAGKIVVPVFLAVAVLLLPIAAVWTALTVRGLAREQSAPGHVVNMVERYGLAYDVGAKTPSAPTQVPYYYPVVEFYTPDEKLHTVQLARGSWPPEYEIGQPVTILYDPAQPVNARVQSDSSTLDMWLGPVLLGFLGLVFLIVALSIAWATRPGRVKMSP